MSGVDALVWVMGSEAEAGDRIEVHQVWGDLLVDVRQVPADQPVSIGSTPAWRWRLLGVDMGRIPALAARVLPWVLPLWSDVTAETRADFGVPTADLPGERDWQLVRDGMVRAGPGWTGFVDAEGERKPLAEAAGARVSRDGSVEFPLGPGMRVVLEVAGQVFLLRRTSQAKRAVARFGVDPGLVGFGGLVATLFAAVIAAAPPSVSSTSALARPPVTEFVAEVALPPPPQKAKVVEAGAKAAKDEGRSGKREASKKEAKGNRLEVRKQPLDRDVASQSGLLAATGPAANLLGDAGLSDALRAGVGSLIGAQGSRFGTGLGNRGPGLGGGGEYEGIGGLGTHGPGTGDRDLGIGKVDGEIGTSSKEIVMVGNIDKALIDEVVKRHLSQIRYCYQRELVHNPALGGKIVVKFTIGSDGLVTSAAPRTSSLGNSAVEQCIAGRFLRMSFPAPMGGGMAIVSYPFLFSPG
jgi:hypothetical protein